MYTFILTLFQWANGQPRVYTIFVLWVIAIFASKAIPALRYRPFNGLFVGSYSVVIPVVDEPLSHFERVLASVVNADVKAAEILVVLNGPFNDAIAKLCACFPAVSLEWRPIAGKRGALVTGWARTTGDVVVFVDSDTIWTETTASELLRPFGVPSVGGVTTHQRLLTPFRNWITRYCDWLESARFDWGVKGQSVLGTIGVLPGRTIAFRRSVLEQSRAKFLHDPFLGFHMDKSDDRDLTMRTLALGFETVYQSTAVVFTLSPVTVAGLIKQQMRWAIGSLYNTIKWFPMMVRKAPLACWHFTADAITPFFYLVVVLNAVLRYQLGLYDTAVLRAPLGLHLLLSIVSVYLGVALRQLPHLRRRPADWALVPVFFAFSLCILTPIRIAALINAARNTGWGTRKVTSA